MRSVVVEWRAGLGGDADKGRGGGQGRLSGETDCWWGVGVWVLAI